ESLRCGIASSTGFTRKRVSNRWSPRARRPSTLRWPMRFWRTTETERNSGSLAPRSQIVSLFFRQTVHLDAERFQLQSGDLPIDQRGNRINILFQLRVIVLQVLGRKRLVRKAHIHDLSGMTLRGGQVDQAPFSQQTDT